MSLLECSSWWFCYQYQQYRQCREISTDCTVAPKICIQMRYWHIYTHTRHTCVDVCLFYVHQSYCEHALMIGMCAHVLALFEFQIAFVIGRRIILTSCCNGKLQNWCLWYRKSSTIECRTSTNIAQHSMRIPLAGVSRIEDIITFSQNALLFTILFQYLNTFEMNIHIVRPNIKYSMPINLFIDKQRAFAKMQPRVVHQNDGELQLAGNKTILKTNMAMNKTQNVRLGMISVRLKTNINYSLYIRCVYVQRYDFSAGHNHPWGSVHS